MSKITKQYLTHLFAEAESGQISIFDLKRKKCGDFKVSEIDKAVRYASKLAKSCDVYVHAALMKPNPKSGRGSINDAVGFTCLHVDIDILNPKAHAETNLPPDEDAALEVLKAIPHEPSLILHTGNGLLSLWILREPEIMGSDEDRGRCSRLLKAVQYAIRSYAASKSWKLDNTADLARLIRIPGTLNHKTTPPKPVSVVQDTGKRYNPDDFEDIVREYDEHVEQAAHDERPRTDVTPPSHDDPYAPKADELAKECAWLDHCRRDAATLPEPEWYAMLSIIGRCQDGRAVSHEWSKGYAKYRPDETNKKVDHALTAAGPRSCARIRSDLGGETYCSSCDHWRLITSPIQLDRVSPLAEARRIANALLQDETATLNSCFEDEVFRAAAVLENEDMEMFEAVRDLAKKKGGRVGQFDKKVLTVRRQMKRERARLLQVHDDRIGIQKNAVELPDMLNPAWDAIREQNLGDEPKIFHRAGSVVRLAERDGRTIIDLVSQTHMFGLLGRWARWYTQSDGGEIPAKPDGDVAGDMLEIPNLGDLPRLETVIAAPTFAKDGSIIQTPGYHGEHAVYFTRLNSARTRPIAMVPDASAIRHARSMILEELLVDFPFKSSSDRAHAIAALLLPFVRRMIIGPTPLHSIEAPMPGSGKTLLADVISLVATGLNARITTLPESSEEFRKKLTSELMRAPEIITWDNAPQSGVVDNADLAAALTSTTWSDRVLGHSRIISVPNMACWLLTANNPRYSMELARRTVRVRIDVQNDQPWNRTEFRHPKLLEWALGHRQDLIESVLTLIQHWVAESKPEGEATIGSFESWARVLGGILSVNEIDGFLEDREQFFLEADSEGEEWREFVLVWASIHGESSVGVEALTRLADEYDLLPVTRGGGTVRSQTTRMGLALRAQVDRIYANHRIERNRDLHVKGHRYRLVLVSASDDPQTEPALWEDS
ncbi:MAG: hypothetical protein DHS20C21_18400 [Gemmatimonadota bacterium]|nr:MAG: hypothetical protein DHS20C21_18400 [Gemmatimonadota bacterium]